MPALFRPTETAIRRRISRGFLVAFLLAAGFFSAAIPAANAASWYSSSWLYRTAITIDHTKVASSTGTTLANFPVLIATTTNSLKYTGSSGHVGKTNGGDILFTSSDGITKLSHEIETYASSTGQLVSWVKVPSIATSTDTTLYMYYGNAAAADQATTTGTWDDGGSKLFKGVWHLNSSVNDSSPTGANLTNSVGTVTYAAGNIGNALTLNGATGIYNSSFAAGSALDATSVTLSLWMKTSVSQSSYHGIAVAQGNYALFDMSNVADYYDWGGSGDHAGTTAINNNQWHMLTLVRSNGVAGGTKIYLDGNVTTPEVSGLSTSNGGVGDHTFNIGCGVAGCSSQVFSGAVDEVKLSATLRSVDWIKTQYNDESSPSTFAPIAAEEVNNIPSGLTATPGNTQMSLSWTAPSNPGGTITDYVVDYKLSATSTWTTFSDGVSTATTAAVTGLTNGVSYDFRVSAVIGGVQGSVTPSVTSIPFTVPGAPTSVSATPSSSSATVTFTAPASNGGSAITGYTVTSSPGGITASGSASPIAISGLTNAISYTFTVTASNGAGAGAASSPSAAVTPDLSYNWYNSIWGYRQKITIDHTKVANSLGGGSLANFPVVISTTTSALAYSGSGGHVGKTNGGDILFTSSDGTTKLSHEIEKYASSTGQLVAWVKVPTLSATADTVLYIYYGNAAAADQATTTGTWDDGGSNNFKGVWHLNDPTNPIDSTGVNNGTNASTTAGTGLLGGGANFSGTNQYLSLPMSSITSMTVGAWVKTTASGALYQISDRDGTTDTNRTWQFRMNASNKLEFVPFSGAGAFADVIGSVSINDGNWHYVAGTYDQTTSKIYVDGNLDGSSTSISGILHGGTTIFLGGTSNNTGCCQWNGSMDEARVSGIARSADWIKTEYNNQNSPTAFSANTTEEGSGVPGTPTSLAAVPGNAQIALSWVAPSDTSGSAVSDYVVEYKLAATSTWSVFADGVSTALSATVTGLSNGSSYNFRVSAVTGFGQGSPSSSATATPITVPGAPTIGAATPGNAQVSVAFTAPSSNGGSAITGYRVTSSPGNFTGSGTTSPIVVSGLSNGTLYTFTVTATNAAGTSTASSASSSATPAAPVVTYFWTGGTTNSNTSNAQNWNTVQGACANSANATVPSASDTVHFTSSCTHSATVDSALSVSNAALDSGYSGTVTMNAALGASASLSVAGGTLNLSASNVTAGAVTLSGGTISGTTGILSGTSYAVQSGTISAIIGGGSAAMTKMASGTVTLSAANTFTGGLNILAGTITTSSASTDVAAYGAGTITLGDGSGGSNAATLDVHIGNTKTFANPIALAGTTTGVLTISKTGSGSPTFSGGITGTNNLVIANLSALGFDLTFSSSTVNFTGTLTNSGSGTASTKILSAIGSNVTGVIENSATSPLILAGSDSFGTLTVKSGTVLGQLNANAFGAGTITLGDSAGGSNPATIESNNSLTFANPIVLASSTTGSLTIANDSSHFTSFSGNISGSNNLIINNLGTSGNTLTLSGSSINNSGSISNLSSGSNSPVAISAVIGSNVTGLIENSSGSALTLSGNNSTVSGNVTITSGTLALSGTTNLNVSGNWSNSGTFAANSSTVTFSTGTHALTGASTFSSLSVVGSNTLTLPASTTQTISGTMTCTGTAGNLITINSSSPGTQATLSKASGTVNCDYLSLTDSAASGGAVWNAGSHSTLYANVTGWSGGITLPSAPTGLSAAAGNLQAALSWSAPGSNGGSAITDYVIDYKLSATSTWTTFSDGVSAATTTIVTGLANGSSYDFRVSAVNAVGQGPVSSTASTTPRSVPDAPASAAATAGNAQASISFSAPGSNGGSAITSYSVVSSPGGFSASSSTSPIIVTGLSNGTAYTFTVTATNAAGTGASSTPSNSVTPATVPDAPVLASATPGNAQASLAWSAPAIHGSAITDYVVDYKLSATSTWTTFADGVSTSTAAVVAGLSNGSPYDFRVSAVTAVGQGAASNIVSATPFTVPGAPASVVATPSDSQASVAFSAPGSNGGSAITGYTVTSSPGGFTGTGTTSPIIVTGLSNGTSYTFAAIAANAAGAGATSTASAAVTPSTVPDAPPGLLATPGNAQASLSWTAPNAHGAAITDYVVDYKLSATSTWTTFADGVSVAATATVTGLANGFSYDFRVSATNTSGQGAASATAFATPRTVPGAPTIGAITPGNARAIVSFTAPVSNGGNAITGYTVTSSPGGFTGTASSSPITVTGLSNGTSYTFTVTAANAAGSSSASALSASTTPYIVPDAPTSPVATAGNAQASVAFSAPVWNGGNAITGYIVTSSPGGFTGTASSSPIIVTGLANATAYTFTVTATNAAGASASSVSSSSVTPSTVPDAPTISYASPGDSQVLLIWSAPAIHGAAITDYVVDYKLSATSTWTTFADGVSLATTATVTGLSNGSSYDFRVSAVTAIGQGAVSVPVTVVPYTFASAPGSPSAVAGNAQATVSFSPSVSSGGASITGYDVTSDPGAITRSGSGSPIAISGLTNGTSYTFTVAAQNAAGSGTASSSTSPVIPSTVPDAPTALSATAGNAQASLSWSVPSYDGGDAITDYVLEYKLSATSTWSTFSDGVSASSSASVTGLANGSAYDFRVSAANSSGQGSASSPASATPITVPGAPASPSAAFGNSQASISFSPPASTGGSAVISYTVTSSPGGKTGIGTSSPITVAGLSNGTAYTFTVTALNAAGTGDASAPTSAVTPATVPDAPTSPVATPGSAQASVAFTAPASNGGSAITSYVATSNPGGFMGIGSASPITVSGLSNGTAYQFSVAAINTAGTSSASALSNSVTPITAPDAPTIGAVTPGNAQASVAFTAPASNGGSAITSYVATSNPGGFMGIGSASPISIAGLSNGTAYTFTVTALNAAGTGSASAASSSTIPYTVPNAPLSLSAIAGNAHADLSWSAPSFDGGNAVADYVVEYKLSATSTWTTFADGVSALTGASVSGLSNGSSYDFRVSAANVAGQGSASATATAVPLTVPGAPLSASAVSGNAQATVSFLAPASDGGTAVTGYIVTSSPGGITATGTSSPITVTGLSNGTAYAFAVAAVNAAGTGAPASSTSLVTPAAPPDAPTSPSAIPGNAQAVVSFTAPVSDGGSAVTLYTVTSSPGNLIATGASSPITITGLSNGVTYTFSVTASNAVGSSASSGPSNPAKLSTEPDAPGNLAATVEGGSVALTWSAPASDGGTPITDYAVEYELSTGGTWAVFADGTNTNTSATVTGLSDRTSYNFRVSAANAIGTSLPSGTATAAPGEPAQVLIQSFPDLTAPTVGTAVRITNEGTSEYEYQYSWCVTDSADHLCGTGHDVFSASNAKLIQAGENWDTTLLSTVSVPGDYYFHIHVIYGSQSSDAYQSFIAVATYPDAPTSVAAAPGDTQATVSFADPVSNGGLSITGYKVTSSPGGLTATGSASPIIVTGLSNGTAYSFTVSAINPVGTGSPSSASAPITPASVPDAPSSVMAAPGDGNVVLSWTAPARDSGSPITDYVVEYKLSADSAWTSFADGVSVLTSATVTGLANGMSYDFRLSAVNAIGQSSVNGASASLPGTSHPQPASPAPQPILGSGGAAGPMIPLQSLPVASPVPVSGQLQLSDPTPETPPQEALPRPSVAGHYPALTPSVSAGEGSPSGQNGTSNISTSLISLPQKKAQNLATAIPSENAPVPPAPVPSPYAIPLAVASGFCFGGLWIFFLMRRTGKAFDR